MTNLQNTADILSLLRCVACGASDLIIIQDNPGKWKGYNFKPSEYKLICSNCDAHYPITDDGIPIVWTSQIRELLKTNGCDYTKLGFSKEQDALSSNISSYNRMSNDYAVNWRRDDSLAKRVQVGSARLKKKGHAPNGNAFHLDIGCGPGHCLEWMADSGYRQIGLDVSLANLRNARKATGAYVVLGDGAEMPFSDDAFLLITASAVLHHIYDWRKVVRESCRVCNKQHGGILYDSEPTVESLELSAVARMVFDLRWPAYKILSYIDRKKIHFRNVSLAKNYYLTAEIHNQPGKGLSVESFREVFLKEGFSAEFFLSPNDQLKQRETIPWKEVGWQRIVLHMLSGHNPKMAKYGTLMVLAAPNDRK